MSDMLQIKMALDLYYNDNGSYPLAFGGNSWGTVNGCGNSPSQGTSGANAYIQGLTSYLPVLPVDPSLPTGECAGYLYAVMNSGKDYKFIIFGNAESKSAFSAPNDIHTWCISSDSSLCNIY